MALHLVLAAALALGANIASDTTSDTTWFVTNRARRAGRFERAIGDSLEFGLVVTRFIERGGAAPARRLFGRQSSRQVESVRLSPADFHARLSAADSLAALRGEGAVLYVHGFATSFRRGIAQAAEIAHRGEFGGPLVVFSWPGHDGPLALPSVRALISRSYREDSTTASESTTMFRAAVASVLAATRPGTLTIVGHSLGAQLVAEALRGPSPLRDSLTGAPLRALVFFAPDISAARFRDSLAVPMAALAARRVVYASAADRMLSLSRLVNHTRRAGDARAARALAVVDVEVVDVTRGVRAEGGLRTLLDPHHAMQRAGTALYDFFGVVRGRPSECREAEGVATRDGERRWRLTRGAVPNRDLACAATDHSVVTRAAPR